MRSQHTRAHPPQCRREREHVVVRHQPLACRGEPRARWRGGDRVEREALRRVDGKHAVEQLRERRRQMIGSTVHLEDGSQGRAPAAPAARAEAHVLRRRLVDKEEAGDQCEEASQATRRRPHMGRTWPAPSQR